MTLTRTIAYYTPRKPVHFLYSALYETPDGEYHSQQVTWFLKELSDLTSNIVSDWYQMGQNWDFLSSISCSFWFTKPQICPFCCQSASIGIQIWHPCLWGRTSVRKEMFPGVAQIRPDRHPRGHTNHGSFQDQQLCSKVTKYQLSSVLLYRIYLWIDKNVTSVALQVI